MDFARFMVEAVGNDELVHEAPETCPPCRNRRALADRYRVHGPPTLLYVALTLLGYPAFFQGEPDRAHRLFDESAGIDVPDRTISVNEPAEARSAFRRGHRTRAFRILRSHVDELLRTGYTDLTTNAAVEFVTIMAAIDRPHDAATVLDYLATSGDFGARAVRTVVADAARKVAVAAPGPDQPTRRHLDSRQVLEFMREVLDDVVDDDQLTAHRPSGPHRSR